jgi:hypothetical protein
MAKRYLSAVVLVSAMVLSFNSIRTQVLCHFLPENSMRIPVDSVQANLGGLTEAQFNQVIDRVDALYRDEIKGLGGELVINRLWDNATVNASAERKGNQWILNMYGGLARHDAITQDGFSLVLCHEMGHQMGGAPKIEGFWTPSWASNEGEADYYGTLKCLRRVFAKDTSESMIAALDVPQLVQTDCAAQFTDRADQLICMRGAMAGMSTATLLAIVSSSQNPDFSTPDKSEVSKTNNAHPAAQCRLDTYLAGSTCEVAVTAALSDTDFKQGTCWDPQTSKMGIRPRCWFQPGNDKQMRNADYEKSIQDGVFH